MVPVSPRRCELELTAPTCCTGFLGGCPFLPVAWTTCFLLSSGILGTEGSQFQVLYWESSSNFLSSIWLTALTFWGKEAGESTFNNERITYIKLHISIQLNEFSQKCNIHVSSTQMKKQECHQNPRTPSCPLLSAPLKGNHYPGFYHHRLILPVLKFYLNGVL